jgi:uncharacterized membrane protein
MGILHAKPIPRLRQIHATVQSAFRSRSARKRRAAGSQRRGENAMTLYFFVKYLHVLGAIVILGTGAGIAFFMLMAHRSRDPAFIARTAATVVVADMIFTLTAAVLQPVSGGFLMTLSATTLAERWLVVSLGLYAVAGLFWIPVIFMQIEMRDLARTAVAQRQPLPQRYFTLFHRWFGFGIPGFGSVMIILWLMIAKPF